MTPKPDLRIVHLVDTPESAPLLARWFVDEWEPYYGPDGPGDAAADLAACAGRDALPICLVALDGSGVVLGTAALKADSLGDEVAEGPWLAAFLVGPDHRRRGIGTALVAAIEDEAARLGYAAIYTSTDAADRIMARRDWRPVGTSQSLRGPITVFRFRIEP